MDSKLVFKKSAQDNQHFFELRRRIKTKLAHLSDSRILGKRLMAIVLPASYLFFYISALIFLKNKMVFYLCYSLLGIICVLIFINLIHDAVHNNVFKKASINNKFLIVFDLIGGNSYIWKKRHILLHHNYQNIAGWDSDIEQAGLIKIYPHDRTTSFHRYQHLLIFLFYPLFLFNWILVRDFKDYLSKNRLIRKVIDIPRIEYVKLFLFKSFFLFYIFSIPIILGISWKQAMLAVCLLLVSGSLFAMLSLLTPHVNDKNEFPVPNNNGNLNISWFEHQFITTNDIQINNWFTRHVMGNFNFHIAHHLFPRISSVYAPEVTQVISEYASEKGLKYRSYGLCQALNYHYKLIKSNALDFNVFEEDM